MRKSIKILMMALAAMLIAGGASSIQAKDKKGLKYNSTTEYNAESLAKGAPGTNIVRLDGRGETEDLAIEDAKMKAVACALFCGFPSGANGAEAAPAIISDPSADNSKFLADFFKSGGEYLNYVKISTTAGSKSVSKATTKLFKVAIGLDISYDALKDVMVKNGLAK
ncbi:MAG: hypothetical protein J5651_02310 [Salinivirgaceae bacterium]|nr:hypothetical protein [Salinivirgaceae bacterium]